MRRFTSGLLYAESCFVFSLAIYMISLGFTHDKEWETFLGVIAFAISGSLGLFFLARGLADSKRWANSPSILANLIALGVSKYQFEAGLYWLAVPTALFSSTVIALIFLLVKKVN